MIDRMELTPSDQAPIPRPWSFRIKGLMLVIVGVAAWLALLRAEPAWAMIVAFVMGPIWVVHRWFSRKFAHDFGDPSSLVSRGLILLLSGWLGLVMVVVAAFVLMVLVLIVDPDLVHD